MSPAPAVAEDLYSRFMADEISRLVSCAGCGLTLDGSDAYSVDNRTLCPACGGLTRNVSLHLFDSVTVHESVAWKVREGGVGKPVLEGRSGDDLHRDSGEWRHLERVVDRRDDWYSEVVRDSSGEIVHSTEEPLSEHRGHGADRARATAEEPGDAQKQS